MRETACLANIHGSEPVKVLQLSNFMPTFACPSSTAEDLQRKFSTFLVSNEPLHGTVREALNTQKELYVLKSPLFLRGKEQAATHPTDAQHLLILEEYRISQAVSNIKGFPKVYGLGYSDDSPVMVAEYIQGITLADAFKLLPRNASKPGINPYIAATVIQTATAILLNARCLDGEFVHRDLSPQNIMVQTSKQSLEQQIEQGIFDLRIVDMGSAYLCNNESLLKSANKPIYRFGTPEYAAPEMLIKANPELNRYSETIDTYALCSILYQMLTGKTPFSLAARITESPYQIKAKEEPTKTAADPESTTLLQLATKGINAIQENRYTTIQLYKALNTWRHNYAQKHSLKSCPPPKFSL